MPVTCPGCGKQYRDPAPGTRVTVKCTGCGQPFEAAAADAPPVGGSPSATGPEPSSDASRLAQLRERGRERARRRDYEIGEVVGKSFSAWFSNFLPFTALSAIVHVPSIGLLVWQSRLRHTTSDPLLVIGPAVIAVLANYLLGVILQGAVIFGVFQRLRRQRASIGASIAVGIRRLLPVMVAAIVVGLVALAPLVVGGLVAVAVGLPLGVVPIGIGAIFALILVLVFYVAVPVVVVENLGPIAAMNRSQLLTKGNRLLIFLTWVLIIILSMIVGCVVAIPFVVSQAALGQQIVQLAVQIVLAPLGAAVPAVVYHDLRVAKEGVNIEDLAKVFD